MNPKRNGLTPECPAYWAEMSEKDLLIELEDGIKVYPQPERWPEATYAVFCRRVHELFPSSQRLPPIDYFRNQAVPMIVWVRDGQLRRRSEANLAEYL